MKLLLEDYEYKKAQLDAVMEEIETVSYTHLDVYKRQYSNSFTA